MVNGVVVGVMGIGWVDYYLLLLVLIMCLKGPIYKPVWLLGSPFLQELVVYCE